MTPDSYSPDLTHLYEGQYSMQHGREEGSGVITIRAAGLESPIGALLYDHYPESNTIWLTGGGILPAYSPRNIVPRLMHAVSEALMKDRKPDVLAFATDYPRMYESFAKIAGELGYDIFPKEGRILSEEEVIFVQEVFGTIDGKKKAGVLDGTMVLRGCYADSPAIVPYEDFPFFKNKLKVGEGDAVFVLLTKNDLPRKELLQKLRR